MKKLVLLFVIACTLAGCTSTTDHHKELEKTINQLIEQSDDKTIELLTLTDFEWEEAFVFTPYMTEDSMSEQLGFPYKDGSDLYMRDDIYVLVFVNEEKAIHYVELDRHNSVSLEHPEKIIPHSSTLRFIQ